MRVKEHKGEDRVYCANHSASEGNRAQKWSRRVVEDEVRRREGSRTKTEMRGNRPNLF